MNFNWDGLSEEIWIEYCDAQGNREENNDYLGCCRAGDLSFDIMVFSIDDDPLKKVLGFDLYVGGIDTGYGYSDKKVLETMPGDSASVILFKKQYPYDYAGGENFESICTEYSYEDFKKKAEERFIKYIETCNYKECSLTEKANEKLNIW